MPKRPLPDSRSVKEQRAQAVTSRVAVTLVAVIILLGLVLYLLA